VRPFEAAYSFRLDRANKKIGMRINNIRILYIKKNFGVKLGKLYKINRQSKALAVFLHTFLYPQTADLMVIKRYNFMIMTFWEELIREYS